MMSLNFFWSPYPFYVGKRLQYKLAQTRKCRSHYNLSLEWNGGHRHKSKLRTHTWHGSNGMQDSLILWIYCSA
jgi:hypothetical protein